MFKHNVNPIYDVTEIQMKLLNNTLGQLKFRAESSEVPHSVFELQNTLPRY